MKKSLCLLLLFCIAAFAFAHPPVNEKVVTVFNASFPHAKEVVWTEFDNFYQVYFEKDDMKCRVYYDFKGNVIKSRCDYAGDKLCPFLTAKLTKKFPGKSIYLVTEINSSTENYSIVTLQDDKQFIQVQCEATGNMTVLNQLNK